MKARLRFYLKNVLHGRYVIELSIHEVGVSLKYPDGIKYGLICKDLKTGDYVLLDNHHPKGPHIHIGSVRKSVSKRLRQADQRKDMSYEFPDGNYQS